MAKEDPRLVARQRAFEQTKLLLPSVVAHALAEARTSGDKRTAADIAVAEFDSMFKAFEKYFVQFIAEFQSS